MTVRLRLTLLYGVLFFVSGLVLIGLLYALLSRSLSPPPPPRPSAAQTAAARIGIGQAADTQPGTSGPPNANMALGLGIESRIRDARVGERRGALRAVRQQAVIALVCTTLVAVALGWLVAGRMLRPLRRITDHARNASESTLSRRIALPGPPDELTELADTFDAMLARLDAAFQSQRQFAARASHELRTPLSIVQAEADVALARADVSASEWQLAETVRVQSRRSARLIDGLLALARSESSLRELTPVDLAELAGDVVGGQVAPADHSRVRLDLELNTATVMGDPALLERLVSNLVENAIRYNHPDGWVRVSVDTVPDAGTTGSAHLRVQNSGPTVEGADLERLFDAFARGTATDGSRPAGFGLGLAIVRSVAQAHRGCVAAQPGPEGGLTVDVWLPLWSGGSTLVAPVTG